MIIIKANLWFSENSIHKEGYTPDRFNDSKFIFTYLGMTSNSRRK